MADNPPITDTGIPLRVSNELFVLERKNVEIEVKIEKCAPWGKRSATGIVFIKILLSITFNQITIEEFISSSNYFKIRKLPLCYSFIIIYSHWFINYYS